VNCSRLSPFFFSWVTEWSCARPLSSSIDKVPLCDHICARSKVIADCCVLPVPLGACARLFSAPCPHHTSPAIFVLRPPSLGRSGPSARPSIPEWHGWSVPSVSSRLTSPAGGGCWLTAGCELVVGWAHWYVCAHQTRHEEQQEELEEARFHLVRAIVPSTNIGTVAEVGQPRPCHRLASQPPQLQILLSTYGCSL
jgi:hypothetical protein